MHRPKHCAQDAASSCSIAIGIPTTADSQAKPSFRNPSDQKSSANKTSAALFMVWTLWYRPYFLTTSFLAFPQSRYLMPFWQSLPSPRTGIRLVFRWLLPVLQSWILSLSEAAENHGRYKHLTINTILYMRQRCISECKFAALSAPTRGSISKAVRSNLRPIHSR